MLHTETVLTRIFSGLAKHFNNIIPRPKQSDENYYENDRYFSFVQHRNIFCCTLGKTDHEIYDMNNWDRFCEKGPSAYTI